MTSSNRPAQNAAMCPLTAAASAVSGGVRTEQPRSSARRWGMRLAALPVGGAMVLGLGAVAASPASAATVSPKAGIQGSTWSDVNGNGVWDKLSDKGIDGVVVTATPTDCDNYTLQTSSRWGGYWTFPASALAPGCTYEIAYRSDSPSLAGAVETYAAAGSQDGSIEVGPTQRSRWLGWGFDDATRQLQGTVWHDVASNGVWDGGVDPGVDGVAITLTPAGACTGLAPALHTTTMYGGYWTAQVVAGCTYTARFASSSLPNFWEVTSASDGVLALTHTVAPSTAWLYLGYGS